MIEGCLLAHHRLHAAHGVEDDFGYVFAFVFSQQPELRMPITVGSSATAFWFSATAGSSGNGSRPEIGEGQELPNKLGSGSL